MSSARQIDLVRISTDLMRNIDVADPFFDSLREDYPGFDEWYSRAAEQRRRVWVVSHKHPIDALCIFKEELVGEPINDQGESLPGHFLKLCTFKVADLGVKYGERLLYAAFCYCVQNKLTSTYVQVREFKHEELVKLLRRYGFVERGRYRQDICYVKDMTPGIVPQSLLHPHDRFEYARLHYPYHLDDESVGKFLVSMTAAEHDALFPDARNQVLAFPTFDRPVFGEMNAISKMLARNVGVKALREGDLLFFYQKGGRRNGGCDIESMGLVEDVRRYNAISEISDDDLNRLPISREAVGELIDKASYVILVHFRLIQYFDRPIIRDELIKAQFEPNHRDVRQISEEVYRRLIKPRTSLYGVSRVNEVVKERSNDLRAQKPAVSIRGAAFVLSGRQWTEHAERKVVLRLLAVFVVALVIFTLCWIVASA